MKQTKTKIQQRTKITGVYLWAHIPLIPLVMKSITTIAQLIKQPFTDTKTTNQLSTIYVN